MLNEPWGMVNFHDQFTLSSGLPVNRENQDLLPQRVPVYGGNGISGHTAKSLTSRPTFVIGRVGEYCGSVHLVEGHSWVTDNALWATRMASGWDLHFLVHYLKWFGVGRLRSQTGQPLVTQGEIGKLILPKPPLREQRQISEILDALDVQVGTFGQLVNKLYFRQAGLAAELLHSVQVKESLLGDHLVENPKNGFSPQAVEFQTGLLALGLSCLTASGFQPLQLKNVPNGDSRNVAATLRSGDLLMSRANTRDLVGLVGRYQDVGYPCIYPDLMMRLTPGPTCRAGYLEVVLRSAPLRRQIQSISQGTSESMVKISGSGVRKLKLAIPDLAEQDRTIKVLEYGDIEIQKTFKEQEKLKSLKQGLMNDLLTGRVRVKDIENTL